jgi:sugar phosphate isomerase/epimerase
MKISIGTNAGKRATGSGMDVGAAAVVLKEVGFDGVDFSMCEYPQTLEWLSSETAYTTIVSDMQSVLDAGLELSQCHLPYEFGVPVNCPEDYMNYFMPIYKNCLRACGAAGCPIAVIHLYNEADADRTFETNKALIEELLPVLHENNVILAIENCYNYSASGPVQYFGCNVTTADEIMRYVELFDDPHVAVCLDVGHAAVTRNNPIKMVHRFGKHLVCLHIHSTAKQDNHCIPGTNPAWLERVKWEDFSAALSEIGYTGTYNLEVGFYNLPPLVGEAYLRFAAAVARAYADITDL